VRGGAPALGRHAWITLAGERGALCFACADLDLFVFLPAGDAAVTRGAGKHSAMAAVVLQWNRARERYERQGLLVEEAALTRAEAECLADADARSRAREREPASRRTGSGVSRSLRARVRRLTPGSVLVKRWWVNSGERQGPSARATTVTV
jgi:hypothetical protein